MGQRVRTKSQMRRAEACFRREANTFAARHSKKNPKPVDLRGTVLHDGANEKHDMPYADYLRTRHWQIVRKLAIRRAGGKCSNCESTKRIQVHHLTYANLWHEYTNDVVVLCDVCHNILHGQYIYRDTKSTN